MSIIIEIGLGVALGLWLFQLPKKLRERRQLRWVESRIVKLGEAPKKTMFQRIAAGLKNELDLLKHYRYARHMTGSRRLF
jgi:hypothetical protein